MSGIFDALPGIDAPVGSISKGLASMWSENAAEGRPSPSSDHAKATQVNFILHLGLRTDVGDAVEQFETAVRFSRRYPSRVVVLCPLPEDAPETEMRAKVYGECTLGKSKEDTRCCEFVMLSYPQSARRYLESQVSTCLSTDLPLYYWAHRFTDPAKLADYRYFLSSARRILIDSATAPTDAVTYRWPNPANVRDLAYARLLPVRQSIGQFLGRYPVAALAGGLRSIRLEHGDSIGAEARSLLTWVSGRLAASGATTGVSSLQPLAGGRPRSLALTFVYADRKAFSWKADIDALHAVFEADFGAGRTVLPTAVSLLAQENALSEAMFF
ncbi:MAG TPA: glucose-6-phosphate dehydrogenase assembly protein OpcA [Opitutaceae bacterium]|jgi:hypothetical protein